MIPALRSEQNWAFGEGMALFSASRVGWRVDSEASNVWLRRRSDIIGVWAYCKSFSLFVCLFLFQV